MVKTLLDFMGEPAAKRVMTQTEGKAMLQLMMASHTHPDVEFDMDVLRKRLGGDQERLPEGIEFGLNVLHSRLRSYCPRMPISDNLALFLLQLADGNPAWLVMWAYTMWRAAEKLDVPFIKLGGMESGTFAMLFPMSIPTTEAMRMCWDAQKAHHLQPDNLLDYRETWEPYSSTSTSSDNGG